MRHFDARLPNIAIGKSSEQTRQLEVKLVSICRVGRFESLSGGRERAGN